MPINDQTSSPIRIDLTELTEQDPDIVHNFIGEIVEQNSLTLNPVGMV